MARDARGIKHIIHPAAVYSQEAVRLALGLKTATLQREIRLGRLRVAKRAGRYYILGCWLLQWLRAGEMSRSRPGRSSLRESEENIKARAVR